MIAGIAVVSLLELTLGLSEPVLAFLGRDPTLTGRTNLWQNLLPLARNVWIGTGYESFWTTQVQETLAAQGIQATVNSSHNGFLEVYMNLGLIGLALYLAVITVAYWNVLNWQQVDYPYGRFAYSLLGVILLYNMAEAGFRGLALIPFFFLVLALDVRKFIATAGAVGGAESARAAAEQYIPSRCTKSHVASGWHADAIRRHRGARSSAPDSAGGPARNPRGMSTAAMSARVRAAPRRVVAIAESEDVQTRPRPIDGTRVFLRRTLRQSHEKT
jgi:O-antigen ligase